MSSRRETFIMGKNTLENGWKRWRVLAAAFATATAVAFTGNIQISAEEADQITTDAEETVTPTPVPTQAPEPTITPTPTATPTPTPKPVVKQGLKKEGNVYRYYSKGKMLKSTWKTVSGKKYYFKSNGSAATYSYKISGKYYIFNTKGQLMRPSKNSVVTIGANKYYINTKGNPIPGWHVISKKLYYVSANGKCAANTKVDKITFTKSGYAKSDSYSKLKIKAMDTVAKVTKSTMSKRQKLNACWYYLNGIRFQPWKFPDTTKKDWPQSCALDLLNTMGGNCYGFANAFAALAKEIGYEPYVIEIPKCHCWVRIDGLYWDNMGNKMGVGYSPMPFKKDQIYKF